MLSVVRTGRAHAIASKLKYFGGRSLQSARTLVQLQDKPYLAGSTSPTFPKYLEKFREDLPYKLHVSDVEKKDLAAYGKEFRPILDKHIEDYGAVLIKGLPLESGDDFSVFFNALDLAPMEYLGGTGPRKKVAPMISLASNEPPEFSIEPHNEMSYLPHWPHLLFLFCEIPPEPGCGGESGLTDVRQIFKELDNEVKETFIRKGFRYHRYLADKSNTKYTSWQESMLTESREEAERLLTQKGMQFRWDEDGALSSWNDRPALAPHYRTGEMLWFNQPHASHWTFIDSNPMGHSFKGLPETKYPYTTLYGDGSSLDPDHVQHVREVSWRCTVGGQLQKSDVLIVDNMLIQHSRLAWVGVRKLLTALAKYKEYQ